MLDKNMRHKQIMEQAFDKFTFSGDINTYISLESQPNVCKIPHHMFYFPSLFLSKVQDILEFMSKRWIIVVFFFLTNKE